jgi:hypothetical protein
MNWVSNSCTVETNCKNGKSSVRLVDTEAAEKFEHVVLPRSGIQVKFDCAKIMFASRNNASIPSEPAYFSPGGLRIAQCTSNWPASKKSKDSGKGVMLGKPM